MRVRMFSPSRKREGPGEGLSLHPPPPFVLSLSKGVKLAQ